MSFEPAMPPYGADDPNARFLSASALDFLLIELVPMAYRVTNQLEEEANNAVSAASAEQQQNGTQSQQQMQQAAQAQSITRGQGPAAGAGSIGGGSRKMDEDEEKDAVFARLEGLGYRVGLGLVERLVFPGFHGDSDTSSLLLDHVLRCCDLLTCLVQILSRQTKIQRYPGCDKVPLQGSVDVGLSETG